METLLKNLLGRYRHVTLSSRWGGVMAAGLLGFTSMANATDLPYLFEGSEYAPAGLQPGDQAAPFLAHSGGHGVIVWEDNAIDGNGMGIGARRLNQHLSGVHSAFRVNESAIGDQRFPKAAVLAGGSIVFAWQSGVADKRSVLVRILNDEGVFLTGDLEAAPASRDAREPVIVALADGSAIVAWAMKMPGETLADVYGRKLRADGTWVGPEFRLSSSSRLNQHQIALASMRSGGFVGAWVAEVGGAQPHSEIVVRSFDAEGTPLGGERTASSGMVLAKTPSLTETADGQFAVAWSQIDLTDGATTSFDIFARTYLEGGEATDAARGINQRTANNQTLPRLAALGDTLFGVWESSLGDGFGSAILGQYYDFQLTPIGSEMIINTGRDLDQTHPTIVSDGSNRFAAAWMSWTGLNQGMDVYGQRFAATAQPLTAMGAPYVEGLSSWQVRVTWPEMTGLAVGFYEVYFNGSQTPEVVYGAHWDSPDLLPGGNYTARIAYVMADGRRSPLSEAATGRTWGKDTNTDGLPDDWQEQYFGPNRLEWPSPDIDSDGDGATNREEFFAGTSPINSADVLRIRIVKGEMGLQMEWNAKPGVLYQPQISTNLRDWVNLGEVRLAPGATDSVSVEDAPANSFFRINRLR